MLIVVQVIQKFANVYKLIGAAVNEIYNDSLNSKGQNSSLKFIIIILHFFIRNCKYLSYILTSLRESVTIIINPRDSKASETKNSPIHISYTQKRIESSNIKDVLFFVPAIAVLFSSAFPRERIVLANDRIRVG